MSILAGREKFEAVFEGRVWRCRRDAVEFVRAVAHYFVQAKAAIEPSERIQAGGAVPKRRRRFSSSPQMSA